jgi:hypothetical protein
MKSLFPKLILKYEFYCIHKARGKSVPAHEFEGTKREQMA